jgi:hypothetical protein
MATTGQHGAIGIVSATKGEVFAKGADGQMRRLAVGDNVYEGDVIVTANGSTAEITPFNGPVLVVQEQQTVAIDAQVAAPAHDHDATAGAIAPLGAAEAARVIQTVGPQAGQDFNATLDDEATAAGLAGGDGTQGGHNFVDLMRIIENVPTVGYDFPANPPGETPIITGMSAVPTTGGPLANNDYSDLVRDDSGQAAHGNVIWNDTAVADTTIRVTSVNGTAVPLGGEATIAGRFGALTIHADGSYSYSTSHTDAGIWNGVPVPGTNMKMYGVGMQVSADHVWTDNIGTLELGRAFSGVTSVTGYEPGFGVGDNRGAPAQKLIEAGESLIVSLDHASNSVTVSLGHVDTARPDLVHWFAYDNNGNYINDGTFSDANVDGRSELSLTIDRQPTAIKTLVVQNTDASEPFDVTGVAYHGLETFTYTITDSNGAQSTAELVITADHNLDLTAPNGGHIVVGADNSFTDLTQVPQTEPFLPSGDLYDPEHISGGTGNDVLSGGPGDDVSTGGGGVDTFVWHLADAPSNAIAPWDVITDFRAGDVLELNDLITSTSEVTVQVVSASGSDPAYTQVVISDGGREQQAIFLMGYEAADSKDMAAQLQNTTHFTG